MADSYLSYGVYFTQTDGKIFLDVCGGMPPADRRGVRVATVTNVEGCGVLDDDSVSQVIVIGGQSWVKQYLLRAVAFGSLWLLLPTLRDLFVFNANGMPGMPDALARD